MKWRKSRAYWWRMYKDLYNLATTSYRSTNNPMSAYIIGILDYMILSLEVKNGEYA